MSTIHRSLIAIGALCALGPLGAASATPIVDDQVGVLVEGFDDGFGILSSPGSFGYTLDSASRSIAPTDPAQPAQIITTTYTPASVRAWGKILVQAEVASVNDLAVALVDPATDCADAACDAQVVFALALEPSTEPGWTFEAAIPPGYDPVAYPELRLRVAMNATNALLPPVIQRLGATWDPLSVLALEVTADASVCSNRTITYTVPTSVSRVGAERLVVKLAAPGAENTPSFLGAPALSFSAATSGGVRHTGAPITVGGLTVHPGDVYWDLDPAAAAVAPGTTFVLTAAFGVPQGTVDGATFRTRATARAANADAITTDDVLTTVTAAPTPTVDLSYAGVYRIFNRDWAEANSTITGRVRVANAFRATCGQTYLRGVATHDLTAFYANAPAAIAAGPSAISDGGVFVPVGATQTFYDADAAPVSVTGPAVVWTLDALAVGASRTFTWQLTLAELTTEGGPLVAGSHIDTTATFRSAYDAESAADPHALYIDVPATPSGIFALGNAFGTAAEISANRNDLPHTTLTYGDTFGFPMRASNGGASRLLGVWMFQRVAPGAELVSASAPAGTTVYFNTAAAGATAPADTPWDATWNATTQTWDLGPTWTTTAPAAGVATWVASRTDALASAYFPEAGVPNAVTVSVTARTVPAASACTEATLSVTLIHDIERYQGVGDPILAVPGAGAGHAGKTDREDIVVDDVLPGFGRSRLTGTATRDGSGPATYTLTVTNDSGSTRTDMAAPVELVVDFPAATINGVRAFLPLVDFDVAGGLVTDLAADGSAMTVRWDVFPPGATETVTLGFLWPRGGVDGEVARLSAAITGQDDYCGTVGQDLSTTTRYTGTPALRLSKSVDLAAVGLGDELTYRLRALNYADTVSQRTVVFDRVPDKTRFVRGLPLAAGAFWFSNAAPPTLPDRLDSPLAVHAELLDSGLFTRGVEQPDGTWTSPVANPTWVAVSLDAGDPPQLGAGVEREARFVVEVIAGATGAIIANRGLVDADVVLGAVSETTRTILTNEPHLTIARDCIDVVAAEETFTYSVSLYNSSSSDNDTAILTEALPAGVSFVSAAVIWNAETSAHAGVEVAPTFDGGAWTWDLTAALAAAEGAPTPLRPLEGATIAITVTADAGLASGTILGFSGVAVATNPAAPDGASFYGACTSRVSNADLAVRAFVDRANPIADDTVLLTVIFSNEDLHAADATGLVVTLPPELTLNGAVSVASPAYGFTDGTAANAQPIPSGDTLSWTFPSRQLTGPAGVPGRLEGASGDVVLRIPITVGAGVGQDFPMAIAAEVATSTGQGDNPSPDIATVQLRTPKTDLYVTADAVATALPGDSVSVLFPYGNLSRQGSDESAVVVALPASPGEAALPSVTLLSAVAPQGVTAYYSDAPLDQAAPAFSGPASPGWAAAPSGLTGPVSFVAFDVGPVAGLSASDQVIVQVALTDPATQLQAVAGASFTTCATIGQIAGAPLDDDPSNDAACATTAVPGVNIAADIVCDPDGGNPGVVVGERVTAQLILENRGTTPAYGLTLSHDLGDFTRDTVDAAFADIRGAGDAVSTPLDAGGAPIRDAVPITTEGDGTWVIGTTGAETEPLYYRNVGLRPGERVVIPVQLTASDSAADGATLSTHLAVTTAYQLGWIDGVDAAEELLVDNADSCAIIARRADVVVQIDAVDAHARTSGDVITWRVTYDNAGTAPAQDVVFTDYLHAGQSFVVGSITGTPAGFDVAYSGPAGWGYTPTGAAGAVDPYVRGFRISGDSLSAPVGGGYTVSGAGMVAQSGDVAVGGDGRIGATGKSDATFTTPAIPSDGRAVLAWRAIDLGDYAAQNNDGVSIAVLDAVTGQVVPGFDALTVDGDGYVDLSALSTSVQAIQLRLTLTGASAVCDYTSADTIALATPDLVLNETFEVASPWSVNDRGDAFVTRYNGQSGVTQVGFLARQADGTYELQLDDTFPTQGNPDQQYKAVYMTDDVALTVGNENYANRYRLYRRDAAGQWALSSIGVDSISPKLPLSFDSGNITKQHHATGNVIHLFRSGSTGYTIVEGQVPGELQTRPLTTGNGGLRFDTYTKALVSNRGDVVANVNTQYFIIYWRAQPDLSTPYGERVDVPTGHQYQTNYGSAFVDTTPDGAFVINLNPTPTWPPDPVVPYLLTPPPDSGPPVWSPLPLPPSADPTQHVKATYTTPDGAILGTFTDTSGDARPFAYLPVGDGTFTTHELPAMPDGRYPDLNSFNRTGDFFGPDGTIFFRVDSDRLGLLHPAADGFTQELLPALTGGATIATVSGLTGNGSPTATIYGHPQGYGGVAWTRGGDGAWTETFLGAPGLTNGGDHVDSWGPGPGDTIIGNYRDPVDGIYKTFTWDLDGSGAADPGSPAPSIKQFSGDLIATGGGYGIGRSHPPSGTVNLMWGPGIGTDPLGNGWGYVVLPELAGISNLEPKFVSPDGFGLGQGYDDGAGVSALVGWRPLGDGTWQAERLPDPDGQGLDLSVSAYWDSQYNAAPDLRVSGSGGPKRLVYDPTAPGGYLLLGLPQFAQVGAISHADRMIGGKTTDNQPVIATVDDEGAPVTTQLPFTGSGGQVTDIYAGVVAGGVNPGIGPALATAWTREDGAWLEHTLGETDYIANAVIGVTEDRHVVVPESGGRITLYRYDDGAYTPIPLLLGGDETGRGYYYNSEARDYHQFDYSTRQSVRDGLVHAYVVNGDGSTEYVVFGTPEAGSTTVPWVSMGSATDQLLYGYLGGGDFLFYDGATGSYTLQRVTGNAAALETIPLGQFDGAGSYDRVRFQQVPVIALSRQGQNHVFVDVTGRADLDPQLETLTGPAGSVIAHITGFASGLPPVRPDAGSQVLSFGQYQPSTLDLWGCEARPSASFDAVSVRFRSDRSPTFTYATQVDDVCQTTASASITAATTTPQITTANDTDDASLLVQTADVSVALEADRRLITAGGDVTFTATVYNAGPYPADAVALTWTPPTGSGPQPQTLDIGALPVGQTHTETFTVSTTGLPDGTNLSANAAVSSDGIDCVATNQSATATATVSNLPNGYVAIAAPATARLLEPFVISVTYGNDSDNDLTNADIAALLPPALTLVSGDATLTGVAIAAGESTTFDLEVRADACDDLDATVTTGAALTSVEDVIPSDNAAAVTTTLLPPAGQLALIVAPDRAEVAPNGLVRWTATIRNDGLQPVANTTLSATIPAGTTYIEGSLTAGTVTAGDVSATFATPIQPGDARQLAFTTHVTAPEGATLTGQAAVTSDGSCPVAVDYGPSAVRTPIVALSKSADRATACGDGPITWTIAVTNPGDTALSGVIVTDAVPTGASYVPGSISGPGASAIGGALSWTLPTLPAGQGVALSLQTTAPASHGATLANTAYATVGGAPAGSSNTATVAIDCDGTLTLSKAWDGDCQAPGGAATVTLTYTLTGSVPAQGATLVDRLPVGLSPQLPVAGATWDATARTLTFAVGAVTPGTHARAYGVDVLADAPQGAMALPAASMSAGADHAVSGGVSGLVLACDDGDPCTTDACDPAVGCIAPPVADGTACEDGDPCTVDGACQAGACASTPRDCSATDACHLDGVCDSQTGVCSAPTAPDETACDDGLACTDGDRCLSGVCGGDDACGGQAGLCDVDAFCNPDTDTCEFAEATCQAERFYALVVDGAGDLVGAIRCEIAGPGDVTCDENPDGTLRVHTDVLSCEP